jgi:phosphatidylinositol alpha-1,6-mannosyltransferase
MHGFEAWEHMRADYINALRRADLVFVNSAFTLRRHQELHGPLSAARVCWLGTEDDDPPIRLADFSDTPTAVVVSRLDAREGQKGHAELIACWPAVISAVPNARLVIAGGGSGLEGIRMLARSSRAAANIDVLGFVPKSELARLLQRAHVFTMPSRQEGFGLVYIEAMRYGLPVIASTHDAGQEINIDGKTGFNVDLTRPDELPERLIALLENSDRAAEMGRTSFCRWQEHFNYSSFVLRFQAVWREGWH